MPPFNKSLVPATVETNKSLGYYKRIYGICAIFQDEGLSPVEQELRDLKESLQDTQPVGVLVDGCKTMDQVRTLPGLLRVSSLLLPGLRTPLSVCHSV